MKIADLTPFFHEKSGGIRRYLLEKINYLGETPGISHVLIIPGKREKVSQVGRSRIYEVSSFPIPKSGGYRFFLTLRRIKEILEEEKPDLLEMGGWYQFTGKFKSKRYHLSVFYHSDISLYMAMIPFISNFRDFITERFLRKKLSLADVIISPSQSLEYFLRSLGLKEVVTVNLGVDVETFNLAKRDPHFERALGIRDGAVKLLYVGRLSKEKNIELLLRLMKKLSPKRYHLLIVGDGPLRDKVRRFAEENSNVTYLGYLTEREELAKIYANSDIFLSTSLGETFGLTFLEAQACGCILVALDMHLESQPFKEFLVKKLEEEAFREAIERAAYSLSEDLKNGISAYIRQTFSWKKTFKTLLSYYEKILTSKDASYSKRNGKGKFLSLTNYPYTKVA